MDQNTSIILKSLASFRTGAGIRELEAVLNPPVPRRTLQRILKNLTTNGSVVKSGSGRATKYGLSTRSRRKPGDGDSTAKKDDPYELFVPLSEESKEIIHYVRMPLSARNPVAFALDFLDSYEPNETSYLSSNVKTHLKNIGTTDDAHLPAGTYGRHILDRLLIDISWSSSRLEGNTYTLLDTKRLIEEGIDAAGKNAEETQMILNHKRAVEMLVEDAEEIGFNRYTFLNLHGLLSENLLSDQTASGKMRRREVVIAGSTYQPASVPQIIEYAFDSILRKADAILDPFEKSFFVLVHIPYLQPFEDVNKRVARISANIPLIKENLCPLTFVDTPLRAYIDATLGVYELNRIDLLRDLFIWAYERSTHQYIKVKNTLAAPDPTKLKHRQALHELVATIVIQLIYPYKTFISQYTESHIPEEDREQFLSIATEEVKRLHEGVIARYRIRPSQYQEWKQKVTLHTVSDREP